MRKAQDLSCDQTDDTLNDGDDAIFHLEGGMAKRFVHIPRSFVMFSTFVFFNGAKASYGN